LDLLLGKAPSSRAVKRLALMGLLLVAPVNTLPILGIGLILIGCAFIAILAAAVFCRDSTPFRRLRLLLKTLR
jgi:hypothetical protein